MRLEGKTNHTFCEYICLLSKFVRSRNDDVDKFVQIPKVKPDTDIDLSVFLGK
jgi:hypothetical protein